MKFAVTLVPTYTFVDNLFQAFVMYAQVGLRVQHDLVWFGSDRYLTKPGKNHLVVSVCLSFTFKDVRGICLRY